MIPEGQDASAVTARGGGVRGLRARLLLLVAAVAVPMLALAAATIWQADQAQRHRAEQVLLERSRGLAGLVDREFDRAAILLEMLANSGTLQVGDLDAFEAEMRAGSARFGGATISLVGPDGMLLLSTAWAPGERRSDLRARPFMQRSLSSGRAETSNLHPSPTDGQPSIAIAVPVFAAGSAPRPAYALCMALVRERLVAMLQRQVQPAMEGRIATVLDRDGTVVARSLNDPESLGTMTMPPVRAGLTAEDAGVIRGVATREGVPVVLAFAQAPFSGYGTVLTMPLAAFEAPARAALLRALGAGAALALGGIGLALFLARRILIAVHRVADAAARPEAASPTTGLPEADALITALAQAGRERHQAEQQRALLMRELDHRAKNVMAVALSLVRLTPREDAARFAAAVEGRIAAMARAHSLLAGGRWGGASLRSLAEGELHGMLDRVRLTGPAVRLAADAVQPVAMLLHELATNATKHGALSVPEGRVALGWEFTEENELRLSWQEYGGPAVEMPPLRQGFGSRLLISLAERQLAGRLKFDWRPEGLAVTLTLPARHVVPDAAGRQAPAASLPRMGEAA